MNELTRDAIVKAAKRAAAKVDHPLSRAEFERLTGISQYHIYRAFPDGGWTEVKTLANLARHPKNNVPLSDDDLLAEFHRVAEQLGAVPTWAMFTAKAQVSADVVRRRFGGLQGTLVRYRSWLEARQPDSPLLTELQARSRHEIPVPPAPAVEGQVPPQWAKSAGTEFGAPINFRGLRHAPINEQGVVFLFGMVSYELGFVVEAVHNAYPDCEAKRCVDRRRDRWQRVRIEFEFRSTHFRDQGHDPAQCDLIVCWDHDWHDCPIEVVELRKVIDVLQG
jgi:hypothetical protein